MRNTRRSGEQRGAYSLAAGYTMTEDTRSGVARRGPSGRIGDDDGREDVNSEMV